MRRRRLLDTFGYAHHASADVGVAPCVSNQSAESCPQARVGTDCLDGPHSTRRRAFRLAARAPGDFRLCGSYMVTGAAWRCPSAPCRCM